MNQPTRGIRLGVNVDHVATLRQARGTPYPDPVEAARVAVRAGADLVTVHLREDRRHIQPADVEAIRAEPGLRLNLEMANVPSVVDFALRVRPDEVCLVPERREERTTEGGLDAAGQFDALRPVVGALAGAGILVSLFIEPEATAIDAAARMEAPCIELHTGAYAGREGDPRTGEAARLASAAALAHDRGLQVNAGHGLNLDNLDGLCAVPWLDTLNIGHSIVARAVWVGLETAVREMRDAIAAIGPAARTAAGEKA